MLRDKGYEVDVNPHDRPLSKAELISTLKAKPYDAVLSLLNDTIDGEVFDATPSVKIFANYTIGFDNFDVAEGKKRGVILTNSPSGGVDRVAEHAVGLILALACRIVEGDTYMRAGKYSGWDPMLLQGTKLKGKTLGLVGCGHIGTEVARIARGGLGMRVIYYDVKRSGDIERAHAATFYPTIEEVLKQADVVSLHVPLLPSTRHLVNVARLKLMKPTAYIVNTSRGAVIDEAALVGALKARTIAGAGLDVYENEPALAPGLIELPSVVLTPHIASSTPEDRDEMAILAATNIINTLDGVGPKNPVYN